MTVWEAIGWTGQAAFFSRFLIQWIASEREGRSVAPRSFWWLSLGGAAGLSVYNSHIGEPVLLVGVLLNGSLYARNLWFTYHGEDSTRLSPVISSVAALALAGVLLWSGAAHAREGLTEYGLWLGCSLVGQGIWSSRFVVQWWHSEREGRSHFPLAFWWMSLVGNLLLLSYALHLGNGILVVGFLPGPFVQVRNLWLELRTTPTEAA